MNIPERYRINAIAALLSWSLPLGEAASAEENICDVKILNRRGCEVGDFDFPKDKLMPSYKALQTSQRRHEANEAIKNVALRVLKDKNYEQAINFLGRLVLAEPDNDQYRAALCDAHVQYGDELMARLDIDGATREYRMALNISNTCEQAKQRLREQGEAGNDP